MNEINDSIVEKIRKLLALATSSNANEAELALLKAKQIASENDVDVTLIEIFGRAGNKQKDQILKSAGIAVGNRKSITQKYVTWILQEHFNVKVIYTGSRQRGMALVFIGKREKITIAEYVQSFLNQEFLKLWRNHYDNSGCILSERDSYLMGVYRGLSAKLTAEQNKVENEKLATYSGEIKQSFALMVVSEKDRLVKATEGFFPELRNVKTKLNGSFSPDAMNKGFVDGGKINIRHSISNSSGNLMIA